MYVSLSENKKKIRQGKEIYILGGMNAFWKINDALHTASPNSAFSLDFYHYSEEKTEK